MFAGISWGLSFRAWAITRLKHAQVSFQTERQEALLVLAMATNQWTKNQEYHSSFMTRNRT